MSLSPDQIWKMPLLDVGTWLAVKCMNLLLWPSAIFVGWSVRIPECLYLWVDVSSYSFKCINFVLPFLCLDCDVFWRSSSLVMSIWGFKSLLYLDAHFVRFGKSSKILLNRLSLPFYWLLHGSLPWHLDHIWVFLELVVRIIYLLIFLLISECSISWPCHSLVCSSVFSV